LLKLISPIAEASERVQVRLGEMAPAPHARLVARVDIKQWPEERRLRALRSFGVAWAWDQIASALERFGVEGLGTVRHGLETASSSYLPYYAHAIPGSGVQTAAGYFGAVHEICGWNIATPRNGKATVAFDRDPIRGTRESLPAALIAEAYGASQAGGRAQPLNSVRRSHSPRVARQRGPSGLRVPAVEHLAPPS
jgi:hypothetical protein